tara:strand:+ start:552 stop:944 length:393 start_codon:yes stop_codon:yes gene_type:complete
MSTRATIRFATREEGVTFNKHPKKWHAQFYKHHDGYPEGLGLDIADCLLNGVKLTNWEVEHIDIVHSDIEYMYYIWQDHGKSIWISIFEMHQWSDEDAECIFVGTPEKLLTKYGSQLEESYYKLNTNNDG